MRRLGLAGMAVVLAVTGCGGDDESLVPAPPPADPAGLYGAWRARQPGGYELRYVFRSDGTYTHTSGVRQRRKDGLYTYEISARGRAIVRGRTLELRPRSGTIERRYAADRKGDFTRPVSKRRQEYQWLVRGSGAGARLTLTIGGGLAVTYRRG